ncbi:hypothetical protein CAAN1_17S02652 [[Candida] anglica]|uniref:Uncharacterized protein n=1 Tax=[Candida] anglica TaxID=148631 RepID=A0ABP0E7C0_9ASCO
MSSVTNRKTVNSAQKQPSGSSSLPSIQKLNPDFVLSVKYKHDDARAKKDLELLLDALYAKGFYAQVRPQDESNLLVFIRLGSSEYAQAVAQDAIRDYEFGVTATSSNQDSSSERLRIVSNSLQAPVSIGGVEIAKYKFVTSVTPITSAFEPTTIVEDVKKHATRAPHKFWPSTTVLKDTYGVRVALYFEFIKYYIGWLAVLSVFGLVSSFKSKNRFSMTYTVINLVWGVLFITLWNRRERYLTNFWGVQNCHKVEEHLIEAAKLNEKKEGEATETLNGNSDGIRFLKQVAFVPVALVFTAVLVSYQLGCFVLEIFLSEIYDGPGKVFLTLLPTVLISVFVPVLTIVYNLVAGACISWESHTNEYTKSNSNLVKTFVLNFLTGYMPLLITSFVYLPFAHLIQPHLNEIEQRISSSVGQDAYVHQYLTKLKSQEDFKYNQGRLNTQFFYFVVTNQVVQLVLKYALPLGIQEVTKLVKKFILKKEDKSGSGDSVEEAAFLSQVRKSVALPTYNVNDDYRGLALQYGYLVIFGPVWSLAPIVSVVFAAITFQLDLFKLNSGKYFQPPVPARVDSIHPWKYALFALTWIGSIVSPIITAFYRHGTAPPKTIGQLALDKASVHTSGSQLIFILFLSEHVFLLTWFVSSTVSNLFKSTEEHENDFSKNDLKIRRDYYKKNEGEKIASKSISQQSTATDNEWSSFSVQSALAEADQRVAEVKKKASRAEQLDDLNKVKSKSDSIVESKDSEGSPILSTMDDNTHFVPPVSTKEPEPVTEAPKEAEVVVPVTLTESPTVTLSSSSGASVSASPGQSIGNSSATGAVEEKGGKKKSTLKKLLSKKK